ncbi:uncharacterized protein E0L32_012212 [Thyridium curvatum]|uniref:Major facilitator superfamily (MFS) profile domain-containing protein n=1 Tax=Thyridium curvatum TaxID=1093900 RepID=A0A507B2H3_9PEZI|nr:uncharacterized protein E0L32_012212 [Thyridium curvatum]TPX17325.1 hypothetical protein E0L32_012212 [Thyridium curvatum]
METGQLVMYDVGSYYAHNEMDLGQWRADFCSHLRSKIYIRQYLRNYPAAEPADEFDDRNRLYSLKGSINYSAGHPGCIIRRTAYNNMCYLCEKYAPIDGIDKYDPQKDPSVTGARLTPTFAKPDHRSHQDDCYHYKGSRKGQARSDITAIMCGKDQKGMEANPSPPLNNLPIATITQDNPSDPPYSMFSSTRMTYLTYLLGMIMLLSTLTSTIYAPLIPMLTRQFSVSIQAINTTVTIYAVFQALSPVFFSSLADSYGRRPVLLGLMVLYSGASIGLSFNNNSYTVLLAMRALQSIGGSPTVPVVYGIVADLVPSSQRGKILGPSLASANAVCAISPVVGGLIAEQTTGSIWVFITLLILSLVLLALTGMTLPETARCVVGNGEKPAHGIWRTWWSILQDSRHKTLRTPLPEIGPKSKEDRRRMAKSFKGFRILPDHIVS